jgi:hypothetical protein
MELLAALGIVAFALYCMYGYYRLTLWLLERASRSERIGRFVSAERGKGGDKFRLSLGKLFTWNVAVNAEKGTLGGSIQVGAPKGRLVVGALGALIAAVAIPKLAGLLLPAALVAVAAAFVRRTLSDSTASPQGREPTKQ